MRSLASRWVFKATVYKTPVRKALSAMETPIPRTFLLWFAAPKCVSPKRGPLTAPSAKLTESASAVSKNSDLLAPQNPFAATPHSNGHPGSNGSSNGQPRLRDKLCLLIRKYELDPNLVKRYAADFCGTQELRDAGRDLIEAFVSTVAEEAAKDRAALLCKLNSYSQPEEVRS